MEKLSNDIEIKLLEYLDGTLAPGAIAELEQLIRRDPQIRERLEQLREVNQLIGPLRPESPSATFTRAVMGHLNDFPKPADRSSVWKGILLLAGILVTAGIASWLVSAGVFDTVMKVDVNPMIQNDLTDFHVPSIPFDGRTVINVIIILNLVAAFFVLDRIVLRPWFRGRLSN